MTAQPFLDKLGITAEYKEWLKEFDYEKIKVPYLEKEKLCWDIMPEYMQRQLLNNLLNDKNIK